MLVSMTGFGRSEVTHENISVKVEARAVNHRFRDIVVKLPRIVSHFEESIRKIILDFVERGRIEISVSVEGFHGKNRTISLDHGLLENYIAAVSDIERRIGQPLAPSDYIGALLQIRDLFIAEETPGNEDELWPHVAAAVQDCMEQLVAMRRTEGAKLHEDIRDRLDIVSAQIDRISDLSDRMIADYRDTLNDRLAEWIDTVPLPAERIAAEVVVFADKSNIDEELARLRSHISQMRDICQSSGPVGRKLDFLLQEIFREVNTIGSKALDQSIAGFVVDAKAEVEKIREQVQNVE